MKTHSFSPSLPFRITLVASALAVAGLAGCSKQERQETKTTVSDAAHTIGEKSKEAYHASKDALANAWDKVKGATFEKRDEFAANAKALSAEMDAKVSKVQAEYSDAQASASRKAAMEELKNSEADYRAKVAALGDATAATWDSAKQNTIAAWDKLQASYYKARAD
jgi:uncharacterized lipoprotein